MAYHVKTRVFEGPFDLLLQLIVSHQLDITELSLAKIVEEYLGFLEAMQELDMEVTSEFLLIAATLVQLKARHLLPDDRELDLDEELALDQERDRLLARLLASLTFKDVAAVLAHRLESNQRYVGRTVGIDQAVVPVSPRVEVPLSLDEFADLADHALEPSPTEPDLDYLDADLPSVEDAIADVRLRISTASIAEFDEIVASCERPIEVVAYFLAVLELARWGVVSVRQPELLGPIQVTHNPDTTLPADAALPESEWST